MQIFYLRNLKIQKYHLRRLEIKVIQKQEKTWTQTILQSSMRVKVRMRRKMRIRSRFFSWINVLYKRMKYFVTAFREDKLIDSWNCMFGSNQHVISERWLPPSKDRGVQEFLLKLVSRTERTDEPIWYVEWSTPIHYRIFHLILSLLHIRLTARGLSVIIRQGKQRSSFLSIR